MVGRLIAERVPHPIIAALLGVPGAGKTEFCERLRDWIEGRTGGNKSKYKMGWYDNPEGFEREIDRPERQGYDLFLIHCIHPIECAEQIPKINGRKPNLVIQVRVTSQNTARKIQSRRKYSPSGVDDYAEYSATYFSEIKPDLIINNDW